MKRFLSLSLAISLAVLVSASADDNVRTVQAKLKQDGFYFGEVNGAFSSEFAAALTRYQIRHGLQLTGQLDEETGKALGAQPAVVASPAPEASANAAPAVATAEPAATPTAETWRRLRRDGPARRTTAATPASPTSESRTEVTRTETTTTRTESAAPAEVASSAGDPDIERLRDYVGAFVLAGLDPTVGAELEFFADRVRYYDEGVLGRDAIRRSLVSYNEKWPRRRFWIAGDITAQRQSDEQWQVTFPLRYELQSGSDRSSGKVLKTLVLEPAGDDLQIVAVNEAKAR